MDEEAQPVAHLGLPLAVAAAGGAAVVASMTRWWFFGPMHGVIAMSAAAVVGGLIGTMLTNSLRCEPPMVTARKAFAFIALAAPTTALIVALFCDESDQGGRAVTLGLAFGAFMLPGAFVALRASRTAQRSRVRSLVGGSDRRAAWRATAVWLAVASLVGSLPALVDGHDDGYLADLFWWSAVEKLDLGRGPMIVALAACAIAAIVVLFDWHAESIVRDARAASGEWRVDESAAEGHALDVGIGHDAWMEHVRGRVTYRDNVVERVAAVGDLASGEELLRKATRRSTIALAFVGAAELATLYVYSTLTLVR